MAPEPATRGAERPPLAAAAFLSLRYYRTRRWRAVTTAVGVALGVALLVAVALVNSAVLGSYRSLVATLAGQTQLELRPDGPVGLPEAWLERVRAAPGVDRAVPVLERRSSLFVDGNRVPLLLRGVDPEADSEIRPLALVAGRPLRPGAGGEILLAEPLFRSLGLLLNEQVRLLTPDGFVTVRVVGAFGGIEPLTAPQGRVAILPLAALQESFGLEGRLGWIDVRVRDDADVAAVEATLAATARGLGFVEPPLERAERLAELTRSVRRMLLLASVMSLVAAGFLIANNALAVVSERRADLALLRALGLRRADVRRWLLAEVAVLSGAGATLGALVGLGVADLMVARYAETLLLGGVTGGAVGGGSGADPTGALPAALPEVVGGAAVLPALALGIAGGVAIALLAALPTVLAATRQPVAAALRSAALGDAPRVRRLALLAAFGAGSSLLLLVAVLRPGVLDGTVIFGAAALALLVAAAALPDVLAALGARLRGLDGVPLWLQLAADSVREHRRRTGAVAASLMVTLAVLVGIFGVAGSYRSSVAAWVDEMFGWDLMVTSGLDGFRSTVPFTARFELELEEVPGVALASPERTVMVDHNAGALHLYAFEMADAPLLRSFESVAGVPGPLVPAALDGERAVAVSSGLAPQLGAAVGDSLDLETPSGRRSYRIAAVIEDPGAASSALYMDWDVFARDWEDTAVDAFALALAPGARPAEVASALRARFVGRYPLQVVSAADFKASVDRLLRDTFQLSQGLVLAALLVACFGLLHAALIGVWQLRHQLAVLRALGAPAGLLARTLIAESWITGGLGIAAGAMMGTVVSLALFRSLQPLSSLELVWSWPLQGYGLGLLAACGLASVVFVLHGRAGLGQIREPRLRG